jgi:hypothetical protein
VLGTNAGVVEGSVVNDRDEPLTNVSAVIIPDPPYRGRADLYKIGTTDAYGRFQVNGVAPERLPRSRLGQR